MALDRRALIVGINHYTNFGGLAACVRDAEAVAALLRQHEDGKPNFDCNIMLSDGQADVTREALTDEITRMFDSFDGEALFYFSGHGALTAKGGVLATSDADKDDLGVAMDTLVKLTNQSTARDVLILLDCCHSGEAANIRAKGNQIAQLRQGATVIAASRSTEVAVETRGHGLFTAALIDALEGGAADHMGWVTAPSIFAYVERRFGGWGQRPIYKTHTVNLSVVRECAPLIDRLKLRQLIVHFPKSDTKLRLDPEYEPADIDGNLPPAYDEGKVALAALLKDYRDAGLIRTVEPGEQLWTTAKRSHEVELTPRGKEYLSLVKSNKI